MYTSPFLDIDKLRKTSWAQKVSGATEKWTQGQEKKHVQLPGTSIFCSW